MTPLLQQMWHGRPGAADQGDQVQLHQLAKLLGRGVDRVAPHRPAGIVDQHVQPPEPVQCPLEKRIDPFLPGDVGMHAEDFAAAAAHFGGGRLDGVGLQCGDNHFGPGSTERLGNHPPQAARAAGNQHDFFLPEAHDHPTKPRPVVATKKIRKTA